MVYAKRRQLLSLNVDRVVFIPFPIYIAKNTIDLKPKSIKFKNQLSQRVSPFFNPTDAVGTCFARFVFQPDETIVAEILEQFQNVTVVDLALGIRSVAMRCLRNLYMG